VLLFGWNLVHNFSMKSFQPKWSFVKSIPDGHDGHGEDEAGRSALDQKRKHSPGIGGQGHCRESGEIELPGGQF
jgi:hypothetical protein